MFLPGFFVTSDQEKYVGKFSYFLFLLSVHFYKHGARSLRLSYLAAPLHRLAVGRAWRVQILHKVPDLLSTVQKQLSVLGGYVTRACGFVIVKYVFETEDITECRIKVFELEAHIITHQYGW